MSWLFLGTVFCQGVTDALTLNTGTGAGTMNAIGTGVVGGVVTSTFLVLLFSPLFYVLIYRIFGKARKPSRSEAVSETVPITSH